MGHILVISMPYVIMKNGKYTGKNPGMTGLSYVSCLQNARIFPTKESAEHDKCGDESIVEVHL